MGGRIRLRILDDVFEVKPGDSILRALQEYGLARGLATYGFARFCWNFRCNQCFLEYARDGSRARGFACQIEARDGTEVLTLPRVLMWKNKLPVRR